MKHLLTLLVLLCCLPLAGHAQEAPAAERPEYYQVKPGDSLSKLAARFHVNAADLAAWNNLPAPDALAVGQRLRLAPASTPSTDVSTDVTALKAQVDGFAAKIGEIETGLKALREHAPPAVAAPDAGGELQTQVAALSAKIADLETNIKTLRWPATFFSTPAMPSIPAGANDYYPPDIREIKDRGKLIVMQYEGIREGFFMYDNQNQFPEFESYHDGKGRVIGYDIELAHKIAAHLGVELELRRTAKNFTEACKLVGRGEADLALSKLTITLDRAQYVNFSMPYVELRLGLLINRLEEAKLGEVKLGAEQDLFKLLNRPEAKIAVETGTAWIPFAKDLFPLAQLTEYADLKATIDAVEKGQALAMLNDEWNIASALRTSPEIAVRVRLAFVPDVKTGLAMAINPTKPNLLSFVNAMLERDHLQTTAAFLLDKYFAKGTADRISSSMALLAESAGETKTSPASVLLIALLCTVFLVIWGVMAYHRHDAD